MERAITNEQFFESISHYEQVLEKEYLLKVEEAEDKEYAAEFFQAILFTNNELVPYPSILFDELLYTFEHNTKLYGQESAYDKTFQKIEEIRLYAAAGLDNLKNHLKGNKEIKLPELTAELISKGEYTLYELITIEEQVSDFTDENLVGVLSLHVAGENLLKKYQEGENNLEDTSNESGNYTLNERTLALYILLCSLGFKQGLNEDRTALASLYHLVMDKNFNDSTKVKNSNIYKSLGLVPNVVRDSAKLNTYLKNIRPFFEKANMPIALDLIDQNIQKDD